MRYNIQVVSSLGRSGFSLSVSGWLIAVPGRRVLEPFFSCALAKVHVPFAGAGTETGSSQQGVVPTQPAMPEVS